MENIRKTIAKNLIELRKGNNMSQSDLAEKLNYSDKAISKWERAESMPDIDVLFKLSTLFGVTVDYLLHDIPSTEKQQYRIPKETKTNQIVITLLCVTFIWTVSAVIYAYTNINLNTNLWQVFMWSVPLSIIILLIFNNRWGKRKYSYILLSIFVWSILLCIFFQFIDYSLYPIAIIGIPIQIAIILWSKLKPSK